MNDSLFSPHAYTEDKLFKNAPVQSERRSMLHRLIRSWLGLSAPDSGQFGTSIEEQERLRHSRLLVLLFPPIRSEKSSSRFDAQIELIESVQRVCIQINKQNQQLL